VPDPGAHAARYDVDYPEALDRLSTFLRPFLAIPILVLLALITGGSETVTQTVNQAGDIVSTSRDATSGIAAGLAAATALMIVFRQAYPRWWFDFQLELARFSARVGSYLALLTDRYPSTVEAQSGHLDVDYPDAAALNRWLPLVKWFLAIPHYVVLVVLTALAILAVLAAWVAILFTGRYPRALFDYVVGVGRWWLRVSAYAFLLVTDAYPPFALR